MIKNHFFVDNLVKTSNDIDTLTELYKTAVVRLASFGFNLRSCNSNNDTLRTTMKQDGKLVEHNCEFDKVLGYKYSPTQNIISISHVNLDNQANSKRKILSESSKVFDPLGLASPVTVRGTTLGYGTGSCTLSTGLITTAQRRQKALRDPDV